MHNFEDLRERFEDRWGAFVSAYYADEDPLRDVIRYVSEGRGKRVRATLAMLCCHSVRPVAVDQALIPAVAVEMVHAYSLVHDDLPCMDDDDIRRGRPTAHRRFDEARALLAGDALLTDSFSVLAGEMEVAAGVALLSEHALACVRELALGCGSYGMVWGQTRDILNQSRRDLSTQDLERIYAAKSGGLLGAACAMGAIVAGASGSTIDRYRTFGRQMGVSFQIVDDLIDSMDGTGKSAGKDRIAGKVTFPDLLGEQTALESAAAIQQRALAQLDLGGDSGPLQEYLDFLLARVT